MGIQSINTNIISSGHHLQHLKPLLLLPEVTVTWGRLR
jgi:hypothetical protein